MGLTNDFLPFAVGSGANVMSQSDYAALAAITNGFVAGTAQSAQLNKVWRQSSIMSAVLAQFIANNSGQSAVDDGTTAALIANLTAAIKGFGDARYGTDGSPSFRNKLANGWAHIAQDTVRNLSTSPQYGLVDMAAGWASGGAVTAGTITQDAASPVGRTGYAFKLSGVTLTGAGQVSWRYRMDSVNALEFKNQVAQFQIAVQHDVGSAITYNVVVRKPMVVDNFSSTTVIATGSAGQVMSGTPTKLVPFATGQSLGDVSTGLEIEVQAVCGAVTGKNFWFTEWQLEEGAKATPFEFRPISVDTVACERVFQKFGFDAQTYTLGMRGNAAAANTQYMTVGYRTKMRSVPAASITGTFSVSNCSQPVISAASTSSILLLTLANTPGDFYFLLASTTTGIILDARL